MGIPLQPVETCISLEWSIPSQGGVAQCLCVFYYKGLSTCSSIACLSLAAQFSQCSHNGSVSSFLMIIFSCSCGNDHQQRESHPSPSFPHISVTQWTKWHACRQPNWLQHLLPKCASISTSQHYAHKSCQFEHVWKTPIQVLLKFVCTCAGKTPAADGSRTWGCSAVDLVTSLPWWPPGELFIFPFLSLLFLSLPKSYFDCPRTPPATEPVDKSLCMWFCLLCARIGDWYLLNI